MVSLTRKAKPDAAAMYEAITSYSQGHRVVQAGTKLRGDHDLVRAAFGQWMLVELPDDQKGRIRTQAVYGQLNVEENQHDQPSPPLARPPMGKFRAVGTWMLGDEDLQQRARINVGDVVDASDPVYRRYPHLFIPVIEERGR
jgi:hypothetical protein